MDINKKYIIIFGTLILSLIIITGAITYYKENQEGNVYSVLPILEEKEYSIWCYGDGAIYNCSNKGSFEPGESVAMTVNLAQFNNIQLDVDFSKSLIEQYDFINPYIDKINCITP